MQGITTSAERYRGTEAGLPMEPGTVTWNTRQSTSAHDPFGASLRTHPHRNSLGPPCSVLRGNYEKKRYMQLTKSPDVKAPHRSLK